MLLPQPIQVDIQALQDIQEYHQDIQDLLDLLVSWEHGHLAP
jgi:hypothetical protein